MGIMVKPRRKPEDRKAERLWLGIKRGVEVTGILRKFKQQQQAFRRHRKAAFEEIEKDKPDQKAINRFKALARERIADCKKIRHHVRRARTIAKKAGTSEMLPENAAEKYSKIQKLVERELAIIGEKEKGRPKK